MLAAGQWWKHDENLAHGDHIILSDSRILFKQLPDIIASLVKSGGKPLEDFIVSLGAIIQKWKSLKESLVFKGGNLDDTMLLVDSSIESLVFFRDKFSALAVAPSAVPSIVSFYGDQVFVALFGKGPSEEAIAQLKAFCRVNQVLAAASFSSLLKWTPKHQYNKSNGKRSHSNNQNQNQNQNGNNYNGNKQGGGGAKKQRW